MKVNNHKSQVFSKLAVVFLWCFLASLFLAIVLVESYENAWGSDFVSFITGARILRSGLGRALYDLPTQHAFQLQVIWPHQESSLLPYKNLPPLALLYIPFSYLPLLISYKLYSLTLVGVALLTSYFSLKAFKNLGNSLWYILPLIFYPSFGSIFAGQFSLFLLLIYLLIYVSIKDGKPMKSGFLTGLLFLKIQYLVSIPFIFFLVKDKKSFAKGLFWAAGLVILVSVILSGPGFLVDNIRLITDTQSAMYGAREENMFTFYSSLSQISLFQSLSKQYLFAINLVLYLIATWIFKKRFKVSSLGSSFTVMILLTLAFCFHGINHDLALLVIPIWIFIDKIRTNQKPLKKDILATLLLILLPLLYVVDLSFAVSFLILSAAALTFLPKSEKLEKFFH